MMTKIDITKLTEEDAKIVAPCVKKDGSLYKSKPTKADAWSKYVWRMLVFSLSTVPQHQCMPVTADDDIHRAYHGIDRNERWDKVRKDIKELDEVVDRVMKVVPKTEWHGVLRWGRALGAF